MAEVQNVVIIWWGPAWHTAAIYTARAWLNPVVYEWFMAGWVPPGWQLTINKSNHLFLDIIKLFQNI